MEEKVRSLRERYVTLAGEELEVPVGKVNLFLARVRQAAESPSVDVEGITALVWSLENPLLKPSPVSGTPMATRETYDAPAFRIMLDCISRKRASLGELDLSAAAKKYTMPVQEAAVKLGIHETSVRKAIASGRLSAWRRGGTYFLDPASVDAYQVSNRGAKAVPQVRAVPTPDFHEKAPLALRFGTKGDLFLRVKWDRPLANRRQIIHDTDEDLWEGEIPQGWRRVAVLTGNKAKGTYRFHVLKPRGFTDPWDMMQLSFAGFHVRGHYQIEGQPINNPKQATAAWDAFRAE